MTTKEFYKSLVLFIIEDVEEDSHESTVQLYNRWKEKTHIVIPGPKQAGWILEYLNSQRNYRRGALIESAVFDGYISKSSEIYKRHIETERQKEKGLKL